MTNILSIDPGYAKKGKGCACALHCRGVLRRVWFCRPQDIPIQQIYPLHKVVVERPQYRAQDARYSHISPETLILLACDGLLLAGLYAGASDNPFCDVTVVTPQEWKGSTPKPVAHGQLWLALSEAEREILGGDDTGARIAEAKRKGALDRWAKPGVAYYPAGFETHNLLDAVALGRKYART